MKNLDGFRKSLAAAAALVVLGACAPAVADALPAAPTGSASAAETEIAWSASQSSEAGPAVSNSAGGVSLSLRSLADEYNLFTPSLEIVVHDCGGKEWSASERVSPVGANVADRAAKVREVAVEQFAKAHQACSLANDIEPRLLAGFEAAYAKFEEMGH